MILVACVVVGLLIGYRLVKDYRNNANATSP